MNKAFLLLLLSLTLTMAATAAPNQQSQSIKQNISTFVGNQFGLNSSCPLPPTSLSFQTAPPDWRLGSVDLLLMQWNYNGLFSKGGHWNPDFTALCLSDLQNFFASHQLDPATLDALKTWINQLPIDPKAITEFENWLQTLGTLCNDNVGVDLDVASKNVGGSATLADGPVAAVPEPSTISSFVLGIGLLGGVLLRLKAR